MSIYAGLSLQQIYERSCVDQGCKRNSALVKMLPSMPDLFTEPTKLDLSTNFLGPKGLKSLLEVVRVCGDLREINLRDQQLTNESIQVLCDVLRTHPSVTHLFLDHNPITIAAGISLLDLVRENAVLEVITLDKTEIRPTVLESIAHQLEKNVAAKRPPVPQELPSTSDFAGEVKDAQTVVLGKPTDDTLVRSALLGVSSSIAPILFDEDPIPAINDLCKRTNCYFSDTQFPAADRAVQISAGTDYNVLGWRRISHAFGSNKAETVEETQNVDGAPFTGHPLFPPKEETFKAYPQQCRRGYSWVFSSMNAAIPRAEYLKSLITPRVVNPFGAYAVKMYVDGSWRYVIVDDQLPVDQDGEFVFTHPINDLYFWGCIIEKALAKVHGSYQALDMTVPSTLKHPLEKLPTCANTMRDFSGSVGVSRDMWHEDFDSQAWWTTLLDLSERASLIAVSTDAQNRAGEVGIEPLHAYRICHVRQINGFYLVNLQSHWAKSTYSGEWNNVHENWKTYPLIAEALGIQNKADTSFWMPYHKFLHCFRSVHILHTHTQLNNRIVESEWLPSTAGGPYFASTWGNNPHFRMTLVEKSSVFVNLTLPDERFSGTAADAVCFHIIRANMKDVGYVIKFAPEDVAGSTEYVITDSVSFQSQLDAGDYWIIPSTYIPGQCSRFFLRVFSSGPLVLSKEVEAGYLTRKVVAVDVSSSGEYCRGEENPQLEIHLPKRQGVRGRILIKLQIEEVEVAKEPTDEQLASSRQPSKAEVVSKAIAMFLLYKPDISSGRRHVGSIPESAIVAQSKYIINDHVFLEAVIPEGHKGDHFTLVGCIAPKGTNALLSFTVFSTFPSISVTEMKPWPKRSATVRWNNSAPYLSLSNRNPQIELVAADSANPTYVIKMEVEDVTDPTIGFIIVENYDNLGQALTGMDTLPEGRIVAKSHYIRHSTTIVETTLPPPGRMMCRSYIIVPYLQPAGSSGTCTITASTPAGGFSLRELLVTN